jgi:hypothetical protein
LNRALPHLRDNAVAYLALFIALGGTSYAAIHIPAGSVGPRQIKNHSITPIKFNNKAIAGSVRAWAIVMSDGRVLASGGTPSVETFDGFPGSYTIRWGVSLPKNCVTNANIDFRTGKATETVPITGGTEDIVAGYVTAVDTQASTSKADPRPLTTLITLDQNGVPTPLAFDVAVIC